MLAPSIRISFFLQNVLFCLVLCAGSAIAKTDLKIYTENLAPLNYEEDGVLTGYATELLQAVLQSAKIKAEFKVLPWARAYQAALDHPNALLYATSRTAERESQFIWIGPISSRQMYLYKLRSRKDVKVTSLADAGRYRLGLVREMASTNLILKSGLVPDSQIDYTPTQESNMKKLLINRIDLMVTLDWTAAYLAKKHGVKTDDLEQVLLLDNQHQLYFAMNKQADPNIVRKLQDAFNQIKKQGLMEKLKAKYKAI